MAKLLKKKSGFTLIELMIVVAILGILAALAVPAFITYVKRSKTGEVGVNMNNIFKKAAEHYALESAPRGTGIGALSSKCVVPSTTTPLPSATPTANKQKFPDTIASAGSFGTMGFLIADPVYYMYGITADYGSGNGCGHAANDADVYTFFAYGDIDGDSILSTFELAVGSTPENELYRGVGFYIINELE